QKNMIVQKQSELQAKRAEWNRKKEDALGEAGRVRKDADGYYQTQSNKAKALVAAAQAGGEATRKGAQAMEQTGEEADGKNQLAKQFGEKKILLVPNTNVATMNVNKMLDYLIGQESSAADGK